MYVLFRGGDADGRELGGNRVVKISSPSQRLLFGEPNYSREQLAAHESDKNHVHLSVQPSTYSETLARSNTNFVAYDKHGNTSNVGFLDGSAGSYSVMQLCRQGSDVGGYNFPGASIYNVSTRSWMINPNPGPWTNR